MAKRKPNQYYTGGKARKPASLYGGGQASVGGGTSTGPTSFPTNPAFANPGVALGGDPNLLAAQDQGQRQTAIADATALYQQNQLQSNYGFDASGGIDANNPYSRAALLQESYKRARAGNTNSYAAQGQLYSGAAQTAQDESTRNYNIGFDQLQKGYQGDRAAITQAQLAAYGGATAGVDAGALKALLAKLNGGT